MKKLLVTLLFFLNIADALAINALTFNIGALMPLSIDTKKGISRFCEHVVKEEYDIVFIQEAWINDYRSQIKRECHLGYSLDLDEQMGLLRNQDRGKVKTGKGKFFSFLFRYLLPDMGIDSGLLILSRYKLTRPSRLYFSVGGSEEYLFDGELAVSKGAIGAYIEHPHLGNVFVATTHLTSNYTDHQYDAQRVIQLKELSEWFKKRSGEYPAILGGDFNISPPGKRYLDNETLWSVLRKSYFSDLNFLKLNFSKLTTFPGSEGKDEGFVDHLLGHNGLIPTGGRVIPKNGISDHHALNARFKFVNQKLVLSAD